MKMAGDTPHPRPLSHWERGGHDGIGVVVRAVLHTYSLHFPKLEKQIHKCCRQTQKEEEPNHIGKGGHENG